MPPVNGARPIKLRRGRQEVAAVREAMLAVLEEDHPMTVRQVFYRLVSLGATAKTETEYALSGVLREVTGDWDVPLVVTRGYPSVTFLHAAGEGGTMDPPGPAWLNFPHVAIK